MPLSLNMTGRLARQRRSTLTYCLHQRAKRVKVADALEIFRLVENADELLNVVLPISSQLYLQPYLPDNVLDCAFPTRSRLGLHAQPDFMLLDVGQRWVLPMITRHRPHGCRRCEDRGGG